MVEPSRELGNGVSQNSLMHMKVRLRYSTDAPSSHLCVPQYGD